MKREEIKQIFYEFLVQEGVLFNFLQYMTIDSAIIFVEQMSIQFPHLWFAGIDLIHALPNTTGMLCDTIEGENFWISISDKWKEKYKELNI